MNVWTSVGQRWTTTIEGSRKVDHYDASRSNLSPYDVGVISTIVRYALSYLLSPQPYPLPMPWCSEGSLTGPRLVNRTAVRREQDRSPVPSSRRVALPARDNMRGVSPKSLFLGHHACKTRSKAMAHHVSQRRKIMSFRTSEMDSSSTTSNSRLMS